MEPAVAGPARPVVAVACSGGPDSMALLHATWQAAAPLGIHVVALHVDHGLQAPSAEWAERVRRWCANHPDELSCRIVRLADAPAAGDSIEAWARARRRAALQAMAVASGAGLLLLAHHRRDQAETVLLQMLRGAGPAGLAGMPRARSQGGVRWVRPWLDAPRESVRAYAAAFGLDGLDDPSNADPRFARSRLRSELWPQLAAAFPAIEAGLLRTAARAQEADAALHALAAQDAAAAALPTRPPIASALSCRVLSAWPAPRRANLLRYWWHAATGLRLGATLLERLMHETRTIDDADAQHRHASRGPRRMPAPSPWHLQRQGDRLELHAARPAPVRAASA